MAMSIIVIEAPVNDSCMTRISERHVDYKKNCDLILRLLLVSRGRSANEFLLLAGMRYGFDSQYQSLSSGLTVETVVEMHHSGLFKLNCVTSVLTELILRLSTCHVVLYEADGVTSYVFRCIEYLIQFFNIKELLLQS